MKCVKTLRILGIAIILSLLVAAIPAAPALAYTYDIEIDPEEGATGEEITVIGNSFGYSDTTERMALIIFAKEDAGVGDYIDTDVETYEEVDWAGIEPDDDGSFVSEFDVPVELTDGDDEEDVTSGTYYIYVTIQSGTIKNTFIRARAEFTVIGGEIEIYPEEGPVDTIVDISGQDFATEEDIDIEYDGDYLRKVTLHFCSGSRTMTETVSKLLDLIPQVVTILGTLIAVYLGWKLHNRSEAKKGISYRAKLILV